MQVLLAALVLAASPAGGFPAGWFLGGQRDAFRLAEVEGLCGGPVALELASQPGASGAGTAMRLLAAAPYRGMRVRLSATLDLVEVRGRVGLWMRVDGLEPHRPLAWDTMQDRPLTGTRGCTEAEVVLEVPAEAETLALGAALDGVGKVQLSGVRLEPVPASVPLTDLKGRATAMGAPGPAPEEQPDELASSRGRIDDAWFNDLGIDGPGLKLHQRHPGRWTDRAGDSVITLEGDALRVKLGAQRGDFTFRRQGEAFVLTGTWGGAAQRYPVEISLSPERLDMRWGIYERHLTREPAAQVEPDCARFTQYSGAVMTHSDFMYVCGEPLTPEAPPVQTAAALLMAGFRRNHGEVRAGLPRHW